MTLKGTYSYVSLIATFFLVVISVHANSQKNTIQTTVNKILEKSISVSSEDVGFEVVVAEIVKQAGIVIYVDDLPKDGKIKIKKLSTVKDILVQVAEQFDFDWRFEKPSQVIMIRRWKDPLDFPTISTEELQLSVENVLSLIPERGFPEGDKGNFHSFIRYFYKSLGDDQIARLKQGSVLGWNDYSSSQRKLFIAGMRGMTHHKFIDAWRQIKWQLQNLNQSKLRVSKYIIPDSGQATQLLAVDFTPSPTLIINPIDLRCFFEPFINTKQDDIARHSNIMLSLSNTLPPTSREEASKNSAATNHRLSGTVINLDATNVTIHEFSEALNSKTGVKIILDKGIRDHVFSLAANSITIEQCLQILCTVNHWRKSLLDDGSIYISWQFLRKYRLAVSDDIKTLRDGVVQALPPSLASFLGVGITGENVVPLVEKPEEKIKNPFPDIVAPRRQMASLAIAARSLRGGIEETPLQTLKWSEMPPELNGSSEAPYSRWSKQTRRKVNEFIVRTALGKISWEFGDWILSGYEDRTILSHPEKIFFWQDLSSQKSGKLFFWLGSNPPQGKSDTSGEFGMSTDFESPLTNAEKRIIQDVIGD